MAIIEKTGVFTYLDGDGNEVRLYPKSKNGSSDAADAVISVLSSDWALDETTGMYKQNFTVNGITSESVPVIGLVPTGTPTPDAEAEAYSHITDAVTGDNTLTLYADEALTTAITIIVKGISATGGSTVADISNLTAAYNGLNNNLNGFSFTTQENVDGYMKGGEFHPFGNPYLRYNEDTGYIQMLLEDGTWKNIYCPFSLPETKRLYLVKNGKQTKNFGGFVTSPYRWSGMGGYGGSTPTFTSGDGAATYKGNGSNSMGAAFTNGAHKAYLKLAKSIFSPSMSMSAFPFNGSATGIDHIATGADTTKSVYDLSGRRVNKAIKGIYIVNGKKVLVK